MNNKFLNFLGICKKAKRLALGTDMVIDSIKKNKSIIIFVTKDFSTNSLKKVENAACANGISIIEIPYTMTDIQFSLGRKCGIISINDSGFADNLLITLKNS